MAPELSHSFFFDKAPSVHRHVPKAVSETDRDDWQRRVDSYGQAPSRTHRAGDAVASLRDGGGEARACLDYCAQSQTLPPRPLKSHILICDTFPTASGKEWNLNLPPVISPGTPKLSKVANRVRIFPSGELEVRTVSRLSTSKLPQRSYGPRFTRGVSGNGRRVIRRAVAARVALGDCQVSLYTLSSQALMADRDFNKAVNSYLAWGRKYLPEFFKDYVIVFELQARGTLHAHILLFKRIPKGLWRRMRDLWAVKYEMGPGSFDVKKIRSPSRAAAYLSKYLTDKKPSYRLGLDADGMITSEQWRIGRNGQSYERIKFRGNAYRVSTSLRFLARPIAEYHLPWGSPLALRLAVNLRGGVQFFPSSADALAFVSANLSTGP